MTIFGNSIVDGSHRTIPHPTAHILHITTRLTAPQYHIPNTHALSLAPPSFLSVDLQTFAEGGDYDDQELDELESFLRDPREEASVPIEILLVIGNRERLRTHLKSGL